MSHDTDFLIRSPLLTHGEAGLTVGEITSDHARNGSATVGSDGSAEASVRPSAPVEFSFIIPVKDEQDTIHELCRRISDQFGPRDAFEIILIDDGSVDDSWRRITSLSSEHPSKVRGLRFRRNAGKAAALSAGFRAARGNILFTMDADLQDDPKEIRRFLAKLAEGYDLVSGWKKVRHDPWHKVLPSRIFNWMLSQITRTKLHDHNCGFKCYRVAVPKSLTLYGEMHRMIPALATAQGFRVGEIEVEHHPRRHGRSKYGFERYLRGFMDMLAVWFIRRYRERPSHFTGAVVFACLMLSAALTSAGAWLGLGRGEGAALFLAGMIMLSTAIFGFALGLIAELLIRGGLRTEWRLPIVEDTRSPNRSGRPEDAETLTSIPLGYP